MNQVSCGNAVPRSRGLEAAGIRMDTSLAAEAEATSLAASDEERQTKAKSSAADTSPYNEAEAIFLSESIAAEALAPDEFDC